MALQTTGPISLEDIAAELGVSTTNMSLRSFSNTAGFATPDAISEFYGYSAAPATPNLYYWDFGATDRLIFQRNTGDSHTLNSDMSVSFWIKPNWGATDKNIIFYHGGPNSTSTNDRFYFQYDYGNNRLVARYRSNGNNSRGLQWSLTSNSSVTGISSGKWYSSNRGNTNSSGFIHLVFTFDYSASSGSSAFKCYWNGAELTNSTATLTASMSTFSVDYTTINGANNNTNNTREADYDNLFIFRNKLLSSSEISTLYNSGTPILTTDVNLDDNVMFFFDAESDPPTATSGDDYTTTWSVVTDQGSAVSY